MRLHFTCTCGARLNCSIRKIGQVFPCPKCRGNIVVPTPSMAEVRKSLKAIPVALPDSSVIEYSQIVSEILDVVRSNTELCELMAYPDLVGCSLDDAIRVLKNITAFVQDRDEASNTSEHDATVVTALASLAAGTTVGGIGNRDAKLRQYKRWLAGQTENGNFDRRPFVVSVFGLIQELKSNWSAIP